MAFGLKFKLSHSNSPAKVEWFYNLEMDPPFAEDDDYDDLRDRKVNPSGLEKAQDAYENRNLERLQQK